MVHFTIMQTALFESYAFLPLAGSLLVQGISLAFLFRAARRFPKRLPDPVFFTLPAVFLGILAIATVVSAFFSSLFFLSAGLVFASLFLLTFFVLLGSSRFATAERQPEGDLLPEEPVVAVEDPLISIGQEFISRVSESMTGDPNLVRLLDFINEMLISHTVADGGVIFLTDDFEDILTSKAFNGKFPPPYRLPIDLPHKPVRVETNFRYAQFALGDTIFGEVAATGKPVLIENGQLDDRIFANGPEDFLKPGSYIIVPLMVKDRVVGVAGVARVPERPPFSADDFRVAVMLSQYAGASINTVYSVQEALERADLEREASIASKIQKTLHPKRLPELPEVGFGSFFNATKGVCGDYYDVILARRDRIVVTIGDVAGKGIQSSMVMIMLRSILHLVTNTTKTPATVLDWINKGITGKIDMDHYATLAFVSYIPSEHAIEFSSAGHQPILLCRAATGKTEVVRQKTDPIGVERGSAYQDMKLTVAKGDIIMLYTDGVVEALNREGRQYGIESLSRVLSESRGMSAKDVAAEVKHNIQAFVGSASLHDDQTVVIMKIKA